MAAKAEHPLFTFPHRHKPDGTIDSICLRCFRTIATVRQESDLRNAEENHLCSASDLGHISHPFANRGQQRTQNRR